MGNNKKSAKSKNKNISKIAVRREVHSEYVAYHDTFNIARIEWAKENRDKLLRKKTPLEEKKEILFALGHGGDLKALYGIQKYLKNPDIELEAWASIAWQECQNDVLGAGFAELFGDEPEPLVMTELGGEGERLRFCFAVSLKGEMTEDRKDKISAALEAAGKKHKSKVEEVLFGKNYVRITALIPMNVAVADFIEDTITQSNTEEAFLHRGYFAVNTNILSRTEIEEWMRGCA